MAGLMLSWKDWPASPDLSCAGSILIQSAGLHHYKDTAAAACWHGKVQSRWPNRIADHAGSPLQCCLNRIRARVSTLNRATGISPFLAPPKRGR